MGKFGIDEVYSDVQRCCTWVTILHTTWIFMGHVLQFQYTLLWKFSFPYPLLRIALDQHILLFEFWIRMWG